MRVRYVHVVPGDAGDVVEALRELPVGPIHQRRNLGARALAVAEDLLKRDVAALHPSHQQGVEGCGHHRLRLRVRGGDIELPIVGHGAAAADVVMPMLDDGEDAEHIQQALHHLMDCLVRRVGPPHRPGLDWGTEVARALRQDDADVRVLAHHAVRRIGLDEAVGADVHAPLALLPAMHLALVDVAGLVAERGQVAVAVLAAVVLQVGAERLALHLLRQGAIGVAHADVAQEVLHVQPAEPGRPSRDTQRNRDLRRRGATGTGGPEVAADLVCDPLVAQLQKQRVLGLGVARWSARAPAGEVRRHQRRRALLTTHHGGLLRIAAVPVVSGRL
mmetsp:Transcript_95571/g.275997  ORF Transcript_95571/g.275997 Transcript_95571/m.275997 type:complete len:332 (-) Transcript_95571:191-1186(-)